MNATLNLIGDIVTKVSRFLTRDYFELESLQHSFKGPLTYAQKTKERLERDLLEGFSYSFRNHEIIIDNKVHVLDGEEGRVWISIENGFENFIRARPEYAIGIMIEKRQLDGTIVPTISYITLPIIRQNYVAQRGKGAWVQQNIFTSDMVRARVSSTKNLEDSYIALDEINIERIDGKRIDGQRIESKGDNLSLVISKFKNASLQPSVLVNGGMLAAGKIDCMISKIDNNTLWNILEVLIIETGGIILKEENYKIIANSHIGSQIKKSLNI